MWRAALNQEASRVKSLWDILSTDERARAERFRLQKDREFFTVARGLLRVILGGYLDTYPVQVRFCYGPYGKPALAKDSGDNTLCFNLSHSHGVALYAISRGRELGIDIETVRVIRDADDIAARFFSRRENEAYRALDPRDKPLGFFNCWTRKEAFIKALGDGLYHPLDRFDVSLAPGEPARILRVEHTPGDHCCWTLHSFLPGPGLVGAVVVRKFAHELASKVVPERIVVRSLSHH